MLATDTLCDQVQKDCDVSGVEVLAFVVVVKNPNGTDYDVQYRASVPASTLKGLLSEAAAAL